MLISIRNWFCLATVVSLILSSAPAQANIDDAEAINKAGRQRMLSQRIARNYLMIGSDVNTQDAIRELENNINLFEQQYDELTVYAPNEVIQKNLETVAQIWQKFKATVQEKPQWEHSLSVIELSDQLLSASEAVVQEVAKHANHQAGQLVNISGRQRMLSQRIAKLYMARAWSLQSEDIEIAMNTAIYEFDNSLQKLRQSNLNSDVINTKLYTIQKQWNYANASFKISDKGFFVPTVVSVTTDSILRRMDDITYDYEQLMIAKTSQ
ncbi:type IV pili methyl-accepting chemotaxis transducer N-terminal domain-containing protein [Endozoicomonas ascidiicola]|uniref:type IV pili methyl-accepting chemotaxis transducer N-terminal domain-containing protein n=1 Tax=Endozoicomonas ascidiicola TaxID=1698521 RepID=UPI0008312212|nr:type IV pili methyl-accepting chemotaxis transducer N-terminal domain-containing protein [Endozoicomonas ascidiicola]